MYTSPRPPAHSGHVIDSCFRICDIRHAYMNSSPATVINWLSADTARAHIAVLWMVQLLLHPSHGRWLGLDHVQAVCDQHDAAVDEEPLSGDVRRSPAGEKNRERCGRTAIHIQNLHMGDVDARAVPPISAASPQRLNGIRSQLLGWAAAYSFSGALSSLQAVMFLVSTYTYDRKSTEGTRTWGKRRERWC
jgi:hypothetical protein